MKIKIRLISTLFLLAVSLFFGVVIIAVAGGAVYPPLYKAGASLVCKGELVIESSRYSYKPGQIGTQHTIFCQDKTSGARTEVTLKAIFAAGLVYSGVIFAVLFASGAFLKLKLTQKNVYLPDMIPATLGAALRKAQGIQTAEEIADRLKKLQVLMDSGQITEAEYQKKRTEILAGI